MAPTKSRGHTPQCPAPSYETPSSGCKCAVEGFGACHRSNLVANEMGCSMFSVSRDQDVTSGRRVAGSLGAEKTTL